MSETELNGYDIIGYCSGILFPASLLPQLYKSCKTKELDDISYGWQGVFMSGLIGSIVYGIHYDLKPIYLSAGVEVLLMGTLVAMKYIYSSPIPPVADTENP